MNATNKSSAVPAEASTPNAENHPIRLLERIGNTPLLRLGRTVESLPHAEIYAKAEWFNPGGSVKDRPAYRSEEHTSELQSLV